MGPKRELRSAYYSKQDVGGNCKRKQEMAEKIVHEPDYRTGKYSLEIHFFYSYSKIVKSKQDIYLIQCSDWLLLNIYKYKLNELKACPNSWTELHKHQLS